MWHKWEGEPLHYQKERKKKLLRERQRDRNEEKELKTKFPTHLFIA